MLNRIYIIVGLLAIFVLAAAFIVPRFIQWSDYRERMEIIASDVVGAEVSILGDIDFRLLPQPRLLFSDVVVGELEEPSVTVESVDAEFSLIEFLRDQYNLTRFDLNAPVIDLTIDKNGLLVSDFAFAGEAGATNVVLESAHIVNGSVRLMDRRASENVVLSGVEGNLRLSGFSGPFQFQGRGEFRDAPYRLRLNTSAVDEAGESRLSARVESIGGPHTFQFDGDLMPGSAPRFEGGMTYRHTPEAAEAAEDIRGDLILESNIEASTDRVVLTGYSLMPDENRPGTRLTGQASIQLGARRDFDAVVNGGVFSLPPRDASEDQAQQPYEFVRLLRELPALPVPPIPGTVAVELTEMGLRDFSLRDVQVEASTDASEWSIESLAARLPGATDLTASGVLSSTGERPEFRGEVSINSQRLDALSQIWRAPGDENALFNTPGSYAANVVLGADALALSSGRFVLDGVSNVLNLRVGFGEEPRLDVTGRFGALSERESAGLLQLLPPPGNSNTFSVSFPAGSFSLRADAANVLDMHGEDLIAEGSWGDSSVLLERVAAAPLGDVAFDAALNLQGGFSDPVVSGTGTVNVLSEEAEGLSRAYELLNMPQKWREAFNAFLPAELSFDLGGADAGQPTLTIDGDLDGTDFMLTASYAGGIFTALGGEVSARGYLEADESRTLMSQLRLGALNPFDPFGEMLIHFNLDGQAPANLTARVTASASEQSVSYSGELSIADAISGEGTIEARLDQTGAWLELLGLRGADLPGLIGTAQLAFEDGDALRLSDIQGTSAGTGFSGELSLEQTPSGRQVDGAMSINSASVSGVASLLGGASGVATLEEGVWPDSPLQMPEAPAPSRGTVNVSIPELIGSGNAAIQDVSFDLNWDAERVRLADLRAEIGDGSIEGSVGLCCDNALTERTLSGRVMLEDVDMTALLPTDITAIAGQVSGGLQFEGTGTDFRSILGRMAGQGNVTVSDLTLSALDPDVYQSVNRLDSVLDMDADALANIIGMGLSRGAFEAETAQGVINIAGGTARLSNLQIDGQDAALSGTLTIGLADLDLGGSFTMVPRAEYDEDAIMSSETGRVGVALSGTLFDPQVDTRLSAMVAALQVRANELEVQRLEQLRLEAEARQREAAEERNRLIEEQLQQMEQQRAEEASEAAEAEEPVEPAPRAPVLDAPQQQPATPPFESGADGPVYNGPPLNLSF
ncbi:hypothetical protein GCM10007989_08220 [Devosia pacifica]|uniref:AsmA domain-containing protein n=1 Tax=Devosia pacifica TaxID=1335967 RepID=A0A918RYL4_9HYPH|nr:AsmA-like C-terminal region-containing protein [Devosia pacifica]GHA15771.1 hypothetical protein GCM10007989_08220 [Devosia pacifica]